MNKFKKNFLNGKGAYRIAFSVCILILCVITAAITDNNNKKDVKTVQENLEAQTDYEFTQEDVERALESIEYEQTSEQPGDNADIEPAADAEPPEDAPSQKISYDFYTPVYGTVGKAYSIDVPVYSATLDDWRIHRGIDINCPLESEVCASEEGLVSEVGYDINLGNYIVITSGDYTCKYASLSSDIKVYEGQYVHKGQALSYVSDSCVSEICDEPHLHFEMTYMGDYVNPVDYLFFQ